MKKKNDLTMIAEETGSEIKRFCDADANERCAIFIAGDGKLHAMTMIGGLPNILYCIGVILRHMHEEKGINYETLKEFMNITFEYLEIKEKGVPEPPIPVKNSDIKPS